MSDITIKAKGTHKTTIATNPIDLDEFLSSGAEVIFRMYFEEDFFSTESSFFIDSILSAKRTTISSFVKFCDWRLLRFPIFEHGHKHDGIVVICVVRSVVIGVARSVVFSVCVVIASVKSEKYEMARSIQKNLLT